MRKDEYVTERETSPRSSFGEESERFVVPMKLGNSSGGKGPYFEDACEEEKDEGDW